MSTVILLNPMGTDVTNFINHTSMVPQLLKGTVAAPTDTVYTIPYNNTSGRSNVEAGVAMLDAKLKSTSGQVLVFGYSEGCQIADWWLSNQGSTPATGVDPANVSFLLIANANRKYGGFVYNHPAFNGVGFTDGKPAATPYRVTDFARQYDGVSDFPTASVIQDALVNLVSVGTDSNAVTGAMNAVASVVNNTAYANAALNAVTGCVVIHNNYLQVEVDDPTNIALQEGNITWVWSPTYPVPLLGIGATFPQSDYQLRTQIEQAYSRPVAIPLPDYANNTGWSIEPFPVPVTPTPVTGWWAEIHTVIAPNGATLTLSGAIPSIGVNKVAVPSGATVAVTGSAPLISVTQNKVITPTGVSLTLIGSHPALGVTLRPDGAALAVTGGTPSAGLSDNKSLTPSGAVLSLTGGVPTAGISSNKIATPSGAALALSGGTPVVVNPHTITPTGAALSLTGGAPVVSVAVIVTPNSAALITTGGTPAVTTPRLVAPAGAALSLIGSHPALDATLRPNPAALTVTGGQPVIGLSDNKTATPTGAPLFLTGGTPIITAPNNQTVTPSGAALGLSGGTPIVATPRLVTPTGTALASTGGTPVVLTPRLIVPTGAALGLSGGIPVVATPQLVTPSGATLTITGGTPTVTVGVSGPSFDAIGAGEPAPGSDIFTFSHTATAGAYVLLSLTCRSSTTPSPTVTYGGTAMTLLGTSAIATGSFIQFFGLSGVAGGAKTVSCSAVPTANAAQTISLTNVSSVGTPVSTTFASQAFSQTVTCTSGQFIVQSFEAVRNADISAYSGGTKRWTDSASAGGLTLSTATATTTFTATSSRQTGAAMAVVFS